MRLVNLLFKKLYFIYTESIKKIHIFIFLVTLIVFGLISYMGIKLDQGMHLNVVNGMGILTSFFILVIDKINVKKLRQVFQKEINLVRGTRKITEGEWLVNTLFSLTMSMFALLGLQYITLIFNKSYVFLLVWLISYIFTSFIFSLIVWSYTESDK